MPRVSRKNQINIAEASPVARTYKTAIYTRLSVEDVRKKVSDSIGTQKAMLIKYLQAQPDMLLYDIYEDVNYTGTNFNRPGFTRMIEDIQAGLVDCVVVKDLSRFGRSFEETGRYLERVFPFLQVRFISVGDNFDSLTATVDESFLMVPLKNLMNEVYARDISRKVQSGFKAKQQRGEFCGSFAPYGYIKEGSNLVVDEEAAAIVKQIYAWRLEGMGIAAIVQKLNGLQISPPGKHHFEKGITKGKKHKYSAFWYTSAVKRVLSYSVYTGNLALGRYKSNFLSGGTVTEADENEWLIFNDNHPAIISKETFDAVQQMRKFRQEEHSYDSTSRSINIFKGLIVCGDCGKHMARERRKEKFAFECYVYKTIDRSACTKKAIREDDLHKALYTYIKCEIDLAVNMSRIISDLQNQQPYKHQQGIMDKQISTLERKLEQNRLFRGSLREDFKDGVLTELDYITMKTTYDEEKEQLQKSLDELSAASAKQSKTLSPDNKWITEFQRFESEQKLSAGMLSALVECIKVYGGSRIEVSLCYRNELASLQGYINNSDVKARADNE